MSPHTIKIRSRTLPRCVGLDRPPNPTGGNRERNCGRARAGSYGLGEAWLAAVGEDEVQDGLGGLDEVGVVGDLGVRLRLLHAA